MIATYSISRDSITPPVHNPEVELFTFMLQSAEARASIESIISGPVPDRFELTHNTPPDDPPDLRACGLGWECTYFPKDQRPREVVHRQCAQEIMVVPPYAKTRGDIGTLFRTTSYPGYEAVSHSHNDEVSALESDFRESLRSKDIPGNDVLLLDGLGDLVQDRAETAIRIVFQKIRPTHIKLVLLVGRDFSITDRSSPRVVQMYP